MSPHNQLPAADLRRMIRRDGSPRSADSWYPTNNHLRCHPKEIIMEYQLWLSIIAVLSALDKPRSAARFDFSDEDIVKVFYWCVIHDRPVSWACQSRNWPLHCRRRALPHRSKHVSPSRFLRERDGWRNAPRCLVCAWRVSRGASSVGS